MDVGKICGILALILHWEQPCIFGGQRWKIILYIKNMKLSGKKVHVCLQGIICKSRHASSAIDVRPLV
jgi:hypothetical protein